MAEQLESESTPPPSKKARKPRPVHFDPTWTQLFQGIGRSMKGKKIDISIMTQT
jgi:hypothetical protein